MAKLPFGFERPQDSPGFLLWQTTLTWQRLIRKALEPYEISHAQFVVMALLLWLTKHKYETNQTLIASWSKLDKMTVSKALKDLTTRKLVQRVEHRSDTRAKTVSLTAQGITLIKKLIPLVESTDAEFFKCLSNTKEQSLITILHALVTQFDEKLT